ncbi:hypothetical protein GBA52_028195 [Prunus armeniaca]|nr:hypothetical protein GBA52_028195 [Prunus armeniaca]
MAIKEDVESDLQEGIRAPLMRVENNLADGNGSADGGSSGGGNPWMVYLSTFVAVCGSYEFGCCAGYSSPTQSAIREDLSLSLAEVVVTGIGAAVMDKAGRKPLILVSASGVVLGCLLTAVSFFLKVHELALTATPILAVTGILVYIGSFSIGMGAVPWVVMSEKKKRGKYCREQNSPGKSSDNADFQLTPTGRLLDKNVHSVCSIMFAIHDNNQQMEITSTSIVIKSLEKKYNMN